MPVKPIPLRQISAIVRQLRATDGNAARCVEFALLAAARPSEAVRLRRPHIDFERREWRTSVDEAGRFARARPLSDETVQLLQAQPVVDDTDLFFPSTSDGMLSPSSFDAVVKSIAGQQALPSSLRFTFAYWAAREGYRGDVIDAALGLSPPRDVTSRKFEHMAAPARLTEAKRLANEWARFCS